MSLAPPRMLLASPATLAELVAHLPAEARAQVAWTPKRIADMAKVLLTEPILTDGVVEAASDAYLEASRALTPTLVALAPRGSELAAVVTTSIEADIKLLATLPPTSAKAAGRAVATMLVVAQLSFSMLEQVDVAELQKAAESLDPDSLSGYLSLMRAAALLTAAVEGLKHSSPVPGRVAALARRADAEAQAFALRIAAEDQALRMPWYDAAAPGANQVAAFASWNPDNQLAWRRGDPDATADERAAWEEAKAHIDSSRPHRKLFT